jgi:hypothetical protein
MTAPASPPGAPGAPAPSSNTVTPASTQENTYNWVYRQLVTDPNDAVGAFAYVLYKQEKIAFIEAIKQSQGREPTSEELRTFHTQTSTQPRIDSYIKSAEQLASDFLTAGLKKQLEDFEEQIRESVLSQKVDAINQELKSRKSGWQWFADIGANLIVSIATILVIGALLGGYQAISRFNAILEQVLQLAPKETVPAPTKPAQPSDEPGTSLPG